jgi:tetratricopeptide (TPR) repeat protein
MSVHRSHCLTALALLLSLAGRLAARAEPVDPIPEVARDRYAEAQDLEKQGKIKEAVAAYEQAVRLGMQTYPRVYLREAAAYARLGDYEAAAARYSVVLDVLGLEGSCRD